MAAIIKRCASQKTLTAVRVCRIRGVTTQAFTAAEAKTFFERVGQLVDSYKPMGAA
jgi:hypothetical protein